MSDKFSKEKRSEIMRSVKAANNKSTELRLIAFLKANKIKGWRRNFKLLGKPDFVFPACKVVIFTDGCFWHGHNCRNLTPASNNIYWANKINRNKIRDLENTKYLKQNGWKVIRIWECRLKDIMYLKRRLGLFLQSSAISDSNCAAAASTAEVGKIAE